MILQVIETVVHRSSRKHQYLGLYSLLDDLVHQLEVSVFPWILIILVGRHLASVTEIVAFVYHHQIVVPPIDVRKVLSVGLATSA